ncbi:MAG: ROK family protein [Chloroflexota bacterium]
MHVLGIDLGGTKVLAGVVDTKTGEVLSTVKKRTRAEHGPDDLIRRLIDAAKQALAESGVDADHVKRVGIGVAGQIDRDAGLIIAAPNLANMSNVKLAEIVSKALDKPALIFNDVEAAAGGEAAFGAGQGKKDFLVVFVGTGIGGMIYRDGQPYTGATHTAGEIGHMVVDMNGRICGCGGTGHLEAYASRTAIVRVMLAAMHAGRESVLREVAINMDPNDPGGSGIRSKAIAQAVASNDALVQETLLTAADYLGAGLASAINFYNPPLIILGGGLTEAVDLFFQAVVTRTKNGALVVPRREVEIVRTGLGDNAGIVGAAVLAGGHAEV